MVIQILWQQLTLVVTENMRPSAGMEGKVRVWNAETDEFCVAVKVPDEAVWDQLASKRKYLVDRWGWDDYLDVGRVRLWSVMFVWFWLNLIVSTDKFMTLFNSHSNPIHSSQFTLDDKNDLFPLEIHSLLLGIPSQLEHNWDHQVMMLVFIPNLSLLCR